METKNCSILICLSVLLVFIGNFAQANATGAKILPRLQVKPMEDRGGLNVRDEKGKPLSGSLTTGMIQYVKERGKDRIEVVDTRVNPGRTLNSAVPSLTMESDLSHAATDDANGGPYLLTVRLFEEAKPRRIVAQWSGVAQTLMSLTANLRQDPRISADGLVGELGNRVVETVAAYGAVSAQDQQKRFMRFIKASKKTESLTTRLVSAEQTAATNIGTPTLISRSGFGVEVTAPFSAEVYVVGLDATGRLRPLLLPAAGHEVVLAPGMSLRIPTGTFWQATETLQPVQEEVVVLTRRKQNTLQPQKTNTGEPGAAIRFASLQDKTVQPGLGLENPLHVIVVDGGNRILPRASGSRDVERFLSMIENDPVGTWATSRLPVQIIPATKPVVHLVAVGINTYPDLHGGDLKTARQEAEKIAAFFTGQDAKVTLLTDGQATRADVLWNLSECSEAATPEDTIVLFWSGHFTTDGGNWGVLPSDTKETGEDTRLGIDAIYERLSVSNAKHPLLLFDMSFDGAISGLKRLTEDRKLQDGHGLGLLGLHQGSEGADEQSAAFTQVLLEGMGGGNETFLVFSVAVASKLKTGNAIDEMTTRSLLIGPNFPIALTRR